MSKEKAAKLKTVKQNQLGERKKRKRLKQKRDESKKMSKYNLYYEEL
ncbi:hypothetical protein [uncultured Lacinutrix sp.]|nr:hypothetical protein [uncultured Lacinutrix sp.]